MKRALLVAALFAVSAPTSLAGDFKLPRGAGGFVEGVATRVDARARTLTLLVGSTGPIVRGDWKRTGAKRPFLVQVRLSASTPITTCNGQRIPWSQLKSYQGFTAFSRTPWKSGVLSPTVLWRDLGEPHAHRVYLQLLQLGNSAETSRFLKQLRSRRQAPEMVSAAASGKPQDVAALADWLGSDAFGVSVKGQLLLSVAARGSTEAVEAVLARGMDINWRNGRGETALYCAVPRGSAPLVSFLLGKGADPTIKDNQGHDVRYRGCSPEVRALLDAAIAQRAAPPAPPAP
jgi:uncharacterized protein